MIIQSTNQRKKYQEIAQLSTDILFQLHQAVKVGVSPREIDALAEKLCYENGAKPNFKGQGSLRNPYQYSTCIAVNDAVVHGVPSEQPLKKGDIVKLDFGLIKDGLNTDECVTVGVGELSPQDEQLVRVGKKAVLNAVKLATAGTAVGDLGHVMESTANASGYKVARQYVGHGIGKSLHEDPQIAAWGRPGKGAVLQEGMVVCVEAQVIAGDDELVQDEDGWTMRTADGSNAVMFEYMVLVGKNEPMILTDTREWGIIV